MDGIALLLHAQEAVDHVIPAASWIVSNWQLLAGLLAFVVRLELFIHRTKSTLDELEKDVREIKLAILGDLATGSPGLASRVRALENRQRS